MGVDIFFHYQPDFIDKTIRRRILQAELSEFKKSLKCSQCLPFRIFMDSLAMLFILAQGLDVVHDVWWQTVLIFSVRVLILICDHGLREKLHFFARL